MDLRRTYAADPSLETDGIELHLDGNAYITLARAGGGNVKYEAAMRAHFAPHKRALQNGTLDDKTATDILHKVYADAVILGWRGLEIDGAPLPYSRENALRVCREFPELWRVIQEEAGKFANYRTEELADMGKASPTGSNGGSSGAHR
jgi:hypothetical protein